MFSRVGVCCPGSSGEGSSGRAVSGHPNLPMPFFEPPGERLRELTNGVTLLFLHFILHMLLYFCLSFLRKAESA